MAKINDIMKQFDEEKAALESNGRLYHLTEEKLKITSLRLAYHILEYLGEDNYFEKIMYGNKFYYIDPSTMLAASVKFQGEIISDEK